MELRVLKYFLVVAQEENFTRAAQKLHLSQPTLSRQLHDLEEEYGKHDPAKYQELHLPAIDRFFSQASQKFLELLQKKLAH